MPETPLLQGNTWVAQPLAEGSKVVESSPRCIEGQCMVLNSSRSITAAEVSGGHVVQEQVVDTSGKGGVVVGFASVTPERVRHLRFSLETGYTYYPEEMALKRGIGLSSLWE